MGNLNVSWAVASRKLNGKAVVKLSLGTNDLRDARRRRVEVHPQIEKLVKSAVSKAKKGVNPVELAPVGVTVGAAQTLTSGDRAAITEQAHHDVMAEVDQIWADPKTSTNPLARGLEAMLAARKEGEYPSFILNEQMTRDVLDLVDALPANMTKAEMLEWARERERQSVSETLATGKTCKIDPPAVTLEGYAPDPSSPDGWRLMETTLIQGESTQRLVENGLAEDGEVERRKLAHAVLMAKAAGSQVIDARKRGEAVETPPRPAPLAAPAAKGRELPTLRELHAKWVKEARLGKSKPERSTRAPKAPTTSDPVGRREIQTFPPRDRPPEQKNRRPCPPHVRSPSHRPGSR